MNARRELGWERERGRDGTGWEREREQEREWRRENERKTGTGTGAGTGTETRMKREGGDPPHQERSRVEDQALLFHTWHHLCKQEVVPAGSYQLQAQDPAPVQRCGTEGRTGHQGQEGGNGNRNSDGGGDGN